MARLAVALGLTGVLLLAGCGQSAGTGAAGPTPPPPTSPAPTSPALTSPTHSGQPPQAPTVQLDGVAERGVEPGCLVLRVGGRKYLLLGPDGGSVAGVPIGVPIRVRAAVRTGVLSHCQEGTPVQVLQISSR
jgi:hypothetical protein